MGLEDNIDRAIIELLRLKQDSYVGIDVQIREDGPTSFWVAIDKEHLVESALEEDIERLKEKLELLEKIKRMQEVIEKFNEEHPQFVPVRYPWPCELDRPIPIWYKTNTTSDIKGIKWSWTDTSGTDWW